LPFPTEVETEKIVEFIDGETALIDALIEQQQRLSELLNEKRQALIFAAVTGKIDVRNWQPQDPTSKNETPAVAASSASSN